MGEPKKEFILLLNNLWESLKRIDIMIKQRMGEPKKEFILLLNNVWESLKKNLYYH